jgi:hypothetical protein
MEQLLRSAGGEKQNGGQEHYQVGLCHYPTNLTEDRGAEIFFQKKLVELLKEFLA